MSNRSLRPFQAISIPSGKYLTQGALSALYGIDKRTVIERKRRGLLPAPRIVLNRRCSLWALEDIEADLKARGLA